MFIEALGGQVSRNEGWVIYLTTQSDEPPAGVFKKKLDYWRNVRDGVIKDGKTLGILYEFPPEMVENEGFRNPDNFTSPTRIWGDQSAKSGWMMSTASALRKMRKPEKVSGETPECRNRHESSR